MPIPYKKSLILAVFLGGCLSLSYCIRKDGQQDALEISRDWCQLADYPAFQQKPQIEISGGMFTRTFEVQFQSEPQAVTNWITQSPGLKIKPEQKADGQHYLIRSSKAAHCEVRIQAGQVFIKTYWS